jgi:hypothetical protein
MSGVNKVILRARTALDRLAKLKTAWRKETVG